MSPQVIEGGCATWNVPIARAAGRIVSVTLAMLLAVTMLPASGLSPAFADEPAPRPATSGGDVALESTNADAETGAKAQAPVAEARQDGMLAADGLLYTVADGGLSLAGFDGDVPEGVLAVPAAVSVDGKDTPVVAVDIAEGQIADKVIALSLSQSVKDIDTATLAPAFPNLLSVEVAAAMGSPLPAASGAASMRAAYSTSGGMLFRPTSVTLQNEDGIIETIECKELLWAPPALVSARVPVECRAIAEGAFADARDLKTVVGFGMMERIADGAFSIDQMEGSKVVVPASSPVVAGEDAERVSASMALMGDAGQKERRRAWHEAGWRSDDIVMGKPVGALTETVAVDAEGRVERTDLRLISYPGMHPEAMDVKHPDENGNLDMADAGLAFTVKSDMTVSVAWQGDKTATPSHLEIPATITIDDVTYPVTEIAASAFEGTAFLTSVTIPEGVTAIGSHAFADCANLIKCVFPTTLRAIDTTTFDGANIESLFLENSSLNGTVLDLEGSTSRSFVAEGALAPAILLGSENERVPLGDDSLVSKSDNSIMPSSAILPSGMTVDSVRINVLSGPADSIAASSVSGLPAIQLGTALKTTEFSWMSASGNYSWNKDEVFVRGAKADGTSSWSVVFKGANGYKIVSADASFQKSGSSTSPRAAVTIGVVRQEAVGTSPLLTSASMGDYLKKADAATLYQPKGSYAAADHAHDARYYTESEVNNLLKNKADADHAHDDRYYTEGETDAKLGAKLDQAAISKYDTNQKIDDALASKATGADLAAVEGKVSANATAIRELDSATVKASEFGTITYEGLGDGDKNAYPTSYRKGGMPSIHEPEREGYEFAGWQWSRGSVSGDGGNLGGAFSEAGDVTLTATWREVVPEANHFFSDGSPLTAGDNAEYQSHVIKVRLADFGGDALSRVAFERNDAAGILRDGAEVRLWVGSDPDVFTNGTQLTLGQTAETSAGWRMQLAQLADESWGVYVGVRIRTADVAADRIQTSYAAGSYVVSLVKMSYEFA